LGQEKQKQKRVGKIKELGERDEIQEGDGLGSDVLIGKLAEVAGGAHAASEGAHEGVDLQVKVAKHFV
jgi:hypothetical protein